MKKALLALLFAAIFMPFAMAQDNASHNIVTTQVTRCQSFLWDVTGQTYTADTVLTIVTDNTIYILDLTINQPGTDTDTVTVPGCFYSWRDMALDSTGLYYDTVAADTTLNTCDSIHALDLTLTGLISDTTVMDACGSYTWHDSTYAEDGTYTWVDSNYAGCDREEILVLSIVEQINRYDTVAHCGYYTLDTNYFDTNRAIGPYDAIYTIADTVIMCDTIVHFHLNAIVDTAARWETKKSCGPYTWYGNVLTESDSITLDCLDTVTMCWTNRKLALTVTPQRVSEIDTAVSACGGFAFSRIDDYQVTDPSEMRNQTVKNDTSFTYHMVMTNQNDARYCFDSTVHMTINIRKHSNRDTVVYACDQFYWDRETTTYTATPDSASAPKYKCEEKNSVGCDSNITLQLTIKKSPVITAINGDWQIQAGQSATLYPTCSEGASYLWEFLGDTAYTDTLVIENCQGNFDVSLMATYDYDTLNPGFACYDTSWISIVTFVGINNAATAEISLFPNPTVGQLNIESNEAVSEVAVFNTIGQQVAIRHNLGNQGIMDLSSFSKGTYTLRISLQNGETIIRKIILTR